MQTSPAGTRTRKKSDDLIRADLVFLVLLIAGNAIYFGLNIFTGTTCGGMKRESSLADITNIDNALELFKLQNGRYPDRLEDLVTRPPDVKVWPERGYLKTIPMDGWGHHFIYIRNGPDGKPEVISYGADGKRGGEGFNADLSSIDEDKEKE